MSVLIGATARMTLPAALGLPRIDQISCHVEALQTMPANQTLATQTLNTVSDADQIMSASTTFQKLTSFHAQQVIEIGGQKRMSIAPFYRMVV